jgi:hypothetical protein
MQSAMRARFAKAFAAGVAIGILLAISSAVTDDKTATLASLGWWIDAALQGAFLGILLGAGASWLGGRKPS